MVILGSIKEDSGLMPELQILFDRIDELQNSLRPEKIKNTFFTCRKKNMKTAEQLGGILKNMYENAPRKEMVTSIHLFGIRYADEIKMVGIKSVVDASGIPSTYRTEINKGIKLADYVIEKKPG